MFSSVRLSWVRARSPFRVMRVVYDLFSEILMCNLIRSGNSAKFSAALSVMLL